MDEWGKKLKALLKAKGYGYCPACNRELDQGDMAWNSASTEYGTGYSMVVCQCQACDEGIFRCNSWYPEITDLSELCYVIEQDLEPRGR